MRIAITGASGTGKTTLAQLIADKYSIPINPVGSRSVAAGMGFQNPYDVDRAGKRKEFQELLFQSKREWEQQHGSFVTDRSYFDNLAYCALHMPSDLQDDAIETYTQAMGLYDLVIFTPKSVFQQLDDGVRKTSAVYHDFYEVLLRGLIKRDYGLRSRVVYLWAPVSDRVKWVERTNLEPYCTGRSR